MRDEDGKPSEVIYAIFKLIVDSLVIVTRLVFQCLWFAGDRLVKMVSDSAESDTENI